MESATFLVGILRAIRGTPQSLSQQDDDIVDRLNHRYTQSILIMFSMVITANQLVGDNIHCFVEAHFSDSWTDYVHQYCWIKNTYYLPLYDDRIPKEHEVHKRAMIPYYQWVPLFLLGQAMMFFLPCLLWRTFNTRSGMVIEEVIEEGWSFYESETAGERGVRLQRMVKHVHRFLSAEAYRPRGCTTNCKYLLGRLLCPLCGRHHGNYLSTLYIIVKIFYVLIAVGQIFILDAVLGYDYHFYGIEIMQKIIAGDPWGESNRFPRVTMCDFKVRFVANTQRYSVQCALPINLFNEKIFIFFWFWYILLGLINLLSLCMWILRTLCSMDHHRYIRWHLLRSRYVTLHEPEQSGALKSFVQDYLRSDGVFVLRLVGHNVDGTTVNELISALWQNYRGNDDDIPLHDIRPTNFDLF